MAIGTLVKAFFQADHIIVVHQEGQLEVDVLPVCVGAQVQVGPQWDLLELPVDSHNGQSHHNHKEGEQIEWHHHSLEVPTGL